MESLRRCGLQGNTVHSPAFVTPAAEEFAVPQWIVYVLADLTDLTIFFTTGSLLALMVLLIR